MRWIAALLWLVSVGAAEERWIEMQTGGFQIFSNAGAKPGRETLVRFEEFRFALAAVLGKPELQLEPPARILLFKTGTEAASFPATQTGRDRFAIVLAAGAPVPREVFRDVALQLLESNSGRMPAEIEKSLADLYSTAEIIGIRVTLGKPLPASERTKTWAKLHMLSTDPSYYGKLKVLFSNLQKGSDTVPAYRNAFGKSEAEIDREAERYLAAGNFVTVSAPNRPLSPERDFPEKPVEPRAAKLAIADLLSGKGSRAIYESLIREGQYVPEAHEGLGLLSLREKAPDAVLRHFKDAMDAGTKQARPFLEYARLESNPESAIPAFERALELDPKLAEAHFLIAGRLTDPKKRIEHLTSAASLAGRNPEYWKALGEALLGEKRFGEAAKAYTQAEHASNGDRQRTEFREARLGLEQQRLDYEAAERKRIAEEKERELRKLKEVAIAEVRALEAKANQANAPDEPGRKVVEWWDGPKASGKLRGSLKQVDCIGKLARLVIESEDRKAVRLLVRDPAQITIIGGGERSFGCGAQKPRRVIVEYFPKSNPKLATQGEVASIEFP